MKSKKSILFAILVFGFFSNNRIAHAQWMWSQQKSGNGIEDPRSICYNAGIYVTGMFTSSNFSIGTCPNCPVLSSQGGYDLYLARYDQNGHPFWTTAAWGPHNEIPTQISSAGSSVYTIGYFGSTGVASTMNFNSTSGGAITLNSNGAFVNSFLARFRINDGKCIWAYSPWSTNNNVWGRSVFAYSSSIIYAAGDQMTGSSQDGLLSQVNVSNGIVNWTARIKNSGFYKITCDRSGNIYAMTGLPGNAFNTNFYNANGTLAYTAPNAGFYLVMYSSTGFVQWVQKICLGPLANWDFTGLEFKGGDLYLSGNLGLVGGVTYPFGDCNNNTPGTMLIGSGVSATTAFLARYKYGNNIVWVKEIGTAGVSDATIVRSHSTNDAGESLITGLSITGNAPPNSSIACLTFTSAQGMNIFNAKYDSQGTAIWANELFNNSTDNEGMSVCWGENGYGYVTGHFTNTQNFSGTVLTSTGSWDGYIGKINSLANAGPDICSTTSPVNIGTPAWLGCASGYSWTGPGGFNSSNPQPAVSVSGTYTLTVNCNGCIETDQVTVSIVPNCNLRESGSTFSGIVSTMFPNPTTGIVTLDLTSFLSDDPIELKVYNRMGGLVIEKEFNGSNSTNLSFSLADYAKGIYFAQIIQGEVQAVQKIILQ